MAQRWLLAQQTQIQLRSVSGWYLRCSPRLVVWLATEACHCQPAPVHGKGDLQSLIAGVRKQRRASVWKDVSQEPRLPISFPSKLKRATMRLPVQVGSNSARKFSQLSAAKMALTSRISRCRNLKFQFQFGRIAVRTFVAFSQLVRHLYVRHPLFLLALRYSADSPTSRLCFQPSTEPAKMLFASQGHRCLRQKIALS